MILSTYFIKQKIAKLIRKPLQRNVEFMPLSKAKSVFIFYNRKDESEVIPTLKKLNSIRMQVATFVYDNNIAPTNGNKNETQQLICYKQDLNLWGYPPNHIEKTVLEKQADILICLDGDKDYTLRYLMLKHPCSFKVGIKRNKQNIYDFSVSATINDKNSYILEQILFYLNTINRK